MIKPLTVKKNNETGASYFNISRVIIHISEESLRKLDTIYDSSFTLKVRFHRFHTLKMFFYFVCFVSP